MGKLLSVTVISEKSLRDFQRRFALDEKSVPGSNKIFYYY